MKQVEAQYNQTVWDIALQEMGSIEGVFDILENNAFIRPDMALSAGQALLVPDKVINAGVVDYYERNGIKPASGLGEAIALTLNDMIQITQTVAYDVAGGAKEFDGVRLANLGDHLSVQINYTDVIGIVTVHVDQSLDGINYDIVSNADYTLDEAKTSHTFNINDLVTNFVRVRIETNGATGTIDSIIWRV